MTEHLAHGLTGDLEAPVWPPLTDDEVRAVLGGLLAPRTTPTVSWRSPRPFSAAAVVSAGGRKLFVKRHDRRVRTAATLLPEHDFARFLGGAGLEVPAPLGTVEAGRWVYEVHQCLEGEDLYRDAMSWTPYRRAGHARSAGRLLARLHRAAAGFDHLPRPPGILTGGAHILTAPDPPAALRAHLPPGPHAQRIPALLDDLLRAAAPVARAQAAVWTHGDWHPSNLSWRAGHAAGAFDFGLSNRAFALQDLALAVERAAISWLDPADPAVDHRGLDALLDGYQPPAGQLDALAAILPVAHVEQAVSEVAYFTAVTADPAGADLAFDGYLLGHARWFARPSGQRLLARLSG